MERCHLEKDIDKILAENPNLTREFVEQLLIAKQEADDNKLELYTPES